MQGCFLKTTDRPSLTGNRYIFIDRSLVYLYTLTITAGSSIPAVSMEFQLFWAWVSLSSLLAWLLKLHLEELASKGHWLTCRVNAYEVCRHASQPSEHGVDQCHPPFPAVQPRLGKAAFSNQPEDPGTLLCKRWLCDQGGCFYLAT